MKKTALLLAAVLLFPVFTGCKKNDEKSPGDLREKSYSLTQISLPEGTDAFQARFTGNHIALFDGNKVSLVNYSGELNDSISLSDEDPLFCFDITPDGNYAAVMIEADPETGGISSAALKEYDQKGGSIKSIEIDAGIFNKESGTIYPVKLLTDSKYYFIHATTGVLVLDGEGNLVAELEDDDSGGVNINDIFKLKDGRAAANLWSFDYNTRTYSYTVRVLNPESEETEEYVIEMQNTASECSFTAGNTHDVLMFTGTGLYDYSFEGKTSDGLLNLLDYGVESGKIHDVKVLENGDIIFIMDAGGYGSVSLTEILRCNITDSAEAERKIITLAAESIDQWTQQYIVNFNKTNKEYRIETSVYSDYSDGTGDLSNKLNLELMAGNIPDIIMGSRFLSSDNYIKKGLFADLYGFMENDPAFNKSDYLENAFTSMEKEGKLYEVFPSFGLHTIAAKKSEIGEKKGWTLTEFADYIATKPDSVYIIEDHTKKSFISAMVQNLFIDSETGKCEFDRDIFMQILEIAKRFPDNPPSEPITREARNGDPIMLWTNFSGFRSIKNMEDDWFGEPITFVGYPGMGENGSYFIPGSKFAVAEKAKNPEGAWEFIKFVLNYVDESGFGTPIKISELEKQMEEAKEAPYFIDENGEKREIVMYSDNGNPIEYNTDADNEKVMNLIKSIKYVRYTDDTLSKILDEEIGAYLSGQKSADDAAGIIKNRVNLYSEEMK